MINRLIRDSLPELGMSNDAQMTFLPDSDSKTSLLSLLED